MVLPAVILRAWPLSADAREKMRWYRRCGPVFLVFADGGI